MRYESGWKRQTPIGGQRSKRLNPVWSPDGSTIAFVSEDGLYLVNSQGGEPQRIFEGRAIDDPQWSPDNRQLAFVQCQYHERNDTSYIYVVDRDGSNPIRLENGSQTVLATPRWSLDGDYLAYSSSIDSDGDQFCGLEPTGYADAVITTLMIADKRHNFKSSEVETDLIGFRQLAWMGQETLAYSVKGGHCGWVLHAVNLNSGNQEIIEHRGILYAWSPATSSLAYTTCSDGNLHIRDFRLGESWAVWQPGAAGKIPWSPDGTYLLVTPAEKVPQGPGPAYTQTIWGIHRDGTQAERLTALTPTESDK